MRKLFLMFIIFSICFISCNINEENTDTIQLTPAVTPESTSAPDGTPAPVLTPTVTPESTSAPDGTPAPVLTPTVTPESTSAPDGTPEPVLTPTVTPVPTQTPIPTATPSPIQSENSVNDTIGTATAISSSTTTWTGEITVSTDVDYYSYYMNNGYDYCFTLTSSSSFDFRIELYASDGTLLTTSIQSGTEQILIHTNTSSRTYYLKVYSFDGLPGTYTITRIRTSTDNNETIGTATAISSSTTTWTGEISASTDVDYYSYYMNNGYGYCFTLTSSSSFNFRIELYASDGALLTTSIQSGTEQILIHTITSSRTYYLKVYSFDGLPGTYTITRIRTSTDNNETIGTATAISSSTTTWTGEITASTDVDYYSYYMNNGYDYCFTLASSSLFNFRIELYASDGTLLTTSVQSGTEQILTHTITSSRTYYLKVYSFDGLPGTYTITRIRTSTDNNETIGTATAISSSTTTWTGEITANADVDFYSYYMNNGYDYCFTLASSSSFNFRIELYASDSTLLNTSIQSGTEQILTHTITSSRTYYLKVYSFDGLPGTYTITRIRTSTDNNDTIGTATAISSSTTTWTGEITVSTDVDFYSYYMNNGYDYCFTLTSSSSFDFRIELYASDGTLLTTSIQSGTGQILTHTITSSRTYYLKVYSFDGLPGTYTITRTRVTHRSL